MNADDDTRIWQGVRGRLDELGALAVAPRLDDVIARRPSRRDTAAGLAGLASTLGLVAVLGALLVVRGGAGTSATTPSPAPTPGPVTAVADDWPFRLTFQLPKATYGSSEEITGLASLTVLDGGSHDIWSSGGGVIGFSVKEIGGPRHLEFESDLSCVRYAATPDVPITTQLRKGGGYDLADPNAEWYRAFLTSSAFTLPAGTWEISAVARFSTSECGSEPRTMAAPLRATILP